MKAIDSNYPDYLDNTYLLADRKINPVLGQLQINNQSKSIRRKELEVLALLAAANGGVVYRDEFIELLWQNNDLVGQRGLTSIIAILRKHLKQDKDNPIIRTIPRRGYQLNVKAELTNQQHEKTLSSGDTIHGLKGYQLNRKISKNSSTVLWEAHDKNGAIKHIRFCLKEEHLQSLLSEIQAIEQIKEINGVRVVDPLIYLK